MFVVLCMCVLGFLRFSDFGRLGVLGFGVLAQRVPGPGFGGYILVSTFIGLGTNYTGILQLICGIL